MPARGQIQMSNHFVKAMPSTGLPSSKTESSYCATLVTNAANCDIAKLNR